MANITLSQLHPAGSELFQDAESFLNELSNIDSISGGQIVGTAATGTIATQAAVSNPFTLTKLAEAYVYVYAIEHVTFLAKSFSLVL